MQSKTIAREKLELITLPYFIISASSFCVHSLLYWTFIIHFDFAIDGSILAYWIPFIYSACIIVFYLRKQLGLLDLSEKSREILLFLSWIFLVLPSLMFCVFLDKQTGALTRVNYPKEIFSTKTSKYYNILHSFADKAGTGLFIRKTSVDRGNEIGLGCYFTCPLKNDSTSQGTKNTWIGVCISDKFSNRVFDNKDKQSQLMHHFIDSAVRLYNNYSFRTNYLTRIRRSDAERNNYLDAIAQTNIPVDINHIIILREEDGNYETRTGEDLLVTILLLLVSNLTWLLIPLCSKLKHADHIARHLASRAT